MVIIRALLILAILAAAIAAQDAVALNNARCIDGRAIDASIDPVTIRLGEKVYTVRVASKENAEAIRKMRPEEALKAIVAFNRDLADRVAP